MHNNRGWWVELIAGRYIALRRGISVSEVFLFQDLLGIAPTGSGKTGAFVIPTVLRLRGPQKEVGEIPTFKSRETY